MRLLVLGGTVFLGRHLVEAAVGRGHTVTIFNRGQANPDLFPEVEKLRGSRDGDLIVLQGRRWDAVLDTSGYVPRIVRASAELLADAANHYTFISSISAYADFSKPDFDESAPVGKLTDESVEEVNGDTYGPLKALCEQTVEQAMPGRTLVIRPGLIVGPYDPTDRFTYWPHRVAQGGEVLAPGRPERQIQIIDARDLAEWTLRMVEAEQTGAYHATGPDYALTMGQLLETCKTVSHSDARFAWVSESCLLEAGATPWMELPLWIPESDASSTGFQRANVSKAISAGLTFRPLAETAQDTLAWDAARPADREWRAGLKPEREQHLLKTCQSQP